MKRSAFIHTLLAGTSGVLLSCQSKVTSTNTPPTKVELKKLYKTLSMYDGKTIETEGLVAHVCPVEGLKLKLRSTEGKHIMVLPSENIKKFEKDLNKKKIKIKGVVGEKRVKRLFIDKSEKEEILLCHIDHIACNDTPWIEDMKKSGKAPGSVARTVKYLREEMAHTGCDYISTVTLTAEEITVIG